MDALLWSKVITLVASPLALSLVLVPIALLLWCIRWKRIAVLLAGLSYAWLLLWSLPPASLQLCQSLEREYPSRSAADYPQVDAIVVLGGGMEGRRSGWRADPTLLAAADRLWVAARLYHAGRAPRVVISGGNTPWSRADQPEAQAMVEFLVDLGVPRSAMLSDEQSQSTYQNAVEVKKILDANQIGKVLLVTSALHMPRAISTFTRAGIDAVAAPADIQAIPPLQRTPLDWIPDAHALDDSSRALKEYAGLWVYRFRGWAMP